MNLKQLRTRTRVQLDDVAEPYLWTDEDLNFNLNEAAREIALRTSLIQDTSITVHLVVGKDRYEFDPKLKMLYVDYCYTASQPDYNLRQTAFEELDRRRATIQMGSGTPVLFALDRPADTTFRSIAFLPTPDQEDIVHLAIRRLPIPMIDDLNEPEIDELWHADMVDWAMHLAYLKDNVDAADADKALFYEQRFDARIGPRITAASHVDRQLKYHPQEQLVMTAS